jgi:pSer/pThr/pTyr-binding forkhead associated (FHA) protein
VAEPPPVARTAVPRLRLAVESGPADGAVFEVGVEGGTFGRATDNPISIADDGLSRQHARIEWQDGAYWLTDLGSTNGTMVNQTRLSGPHRLADGDVIRAGRTRIAVSVASATD